jgi:hypothetical protein
MGTHGPTGPSHCFTEHVADQVVHRAACAVLTMRSPFPEQKRLLP